MSHTPIPWKVREIDLGTTERPNYRYEVSAAGVGRGMSFELHQFIDGGGRRQKYPDGIIYSMAQAKKDAEFVVLVVNSHTIMVSALQAVVQFVMERRHWLGEVSVEMAEVEAQAIQALAAAGVPHG